jgi:hypothetical protein
MAAKSACVQSQLEHQSFLLVVGMREKRYAPKWN